MDLLIPVWGVVSGIRLLDNGPAFLNIGMEYVNNLLTAVIMFNGGASQNATNMKFLRLVIFSFMALLNLHAYAHPYYKQILSRKEIADGVFSKYRSYSFEWNSEWILYKNHRYDYSLRNFSKRITKVHS